MRNLLSALALTLITTIPVKAQNVAISADKSPADPSAILELKSNDKGILIPRLSKQERNAITNPAKGLLIFQNDDTTGFWFYSGTQWLAMQDNLGNHTMSQNIKTNGNFISAKGDNTGIKVNDSGLVKIYGKWDYSPTTVTEQFRFDPNGGFLAKGNLGIGTIPAQGGGYRMMWHPYKSSFRAGAANSNEWDDANTGFFSWAGGGYTTASGYASFAFGDNSKATNSLAVAMGSYNTASGAASTAFGRTNTASGFAASTLGSYNVAKGYSSTVVGMYNDTLLSADETVSNTSTPLFVVGNGSSTTARSNAMVVRKNGNVEVDNLVIGGGTNISKQQSGTFFIGSSTTTSKSVTFNFPTAFSAVPRIIATPKAEAGTNYPDAFVVTVRSVTTTSVTFNINRIDSNLPWGQQLLLDWIAWN